MGYAGFLRFPLKVFFKNGLKRLPAAFRRGFLTVWAFGPGSRKSSDSLAGEIRTVHVVGIVPGDRAYREFVQITMVPSDVARAFPKFDSRRMVARYTFVALVKVLMLEGFALARFNTFALRAFKESSITIPGNNSACR